MNELLGPDRAFEVLGRLVTERDDAVFDARLDSRVESFVRFGCNTVLQATRVRVPKVTVRAVVDGYVAQASATSMDMAVLRGVRDRALALARAGKSALAPEPPGRADPGGPLVCLRDDAWDEATAVASAAEPADRLAASFREAERAGVVLAGRYVTGFVERAVVSSTGVRRYTRGSRAECRVFATDGVLSGMDGSLGVATGRLALGSYVETAIDKCVRSRRPVSFAPGRYDVILEPAAVAELLEWMGQIAFTPRSVEDGTSFVAGRLGQAVTGARVTVIDDGSAPGGLGLYNPFDAEGALRERVVLLERGVARGVVYDSASARRAGCASTGHAVSPDDSPGGGAAAANLALDGGDDTVADLLARVERGLWVTSFHYVNGLLEPRRAVMTGLTRHGTFRIDDGRLGPGVHNLRFTDSILEALGRVDGLTAARSVVPTWWSSLGACVAPTVLIRGLEFTGTTEEAAPRPDHP